jgi:hypothetical protein
VGGPVVSDVPDQLPERRGSFHAMRAHARVWHEIRRRYRFMKIALCWTVVTFAIALDPGLIYGVAVSL